MNEKFAFAGKADVYMRFLDPALDNGFFLVGDINEMSISTESDKKDLISNQKTIKGALSTMVGNTKHNLSLKSKYFDKRAFAMRAGGVTEETALTAQTITDELFENIKVGGLYPLANQNIDTATPVTAKKGKTGTTALTADDFDIVDGFLVIKKGGSLVDGDAVRVTYKTKATTQVLVKGGKRDKYAVAIMYKGINAADNDKAFDMTIPRAEISPDGDFSFIGDDFGEASFTGSLVLVDGKDSPYEYVTYG